MYMYSLDAPTSVTDSSGLTPPSCPAITVIPRSKWGRRSPNPNNMTPDPSKRSRIVIHHQGRSAIGAHLGDNDRQFTEMRRVEHGHMKKQGYGDVGYNFAIGAQGQIFEGRSLQYQGAHLEGANPGTIGILIIGNYSGKLHMTPEAEHSLCNLLKNLAYAHGIALTRANVIGHTEGLPGGHGSTECPGSLLGDLPRILQDCSSRR